MPNEGEGKLLLEQIRSISKEILEKLLDVDRKLDVLEDSLKLNEEANRQALISQIDEIRRQIGFIEKEDTEGIEDEEILENIIKKLNYIINMTFG
jgi:hypothetical protein